MALDQTNNQNPLLRVLRFSYGHWRRHPLPITAAVGGVLASTGIDVVLPVFAGHMVDALRFVTPTMCEPAQETLKPAGGGQVCIVVGDHRLLPAPGSASALSPPGSQLRHRTDMSRQSGWPFGHMRYTPCRPPT